LDYAGLLHQGGASEEEVIPILRQAVVLMPDNVDARFNLGSILLARREYRDALNQLGTIRKVTPERAFSYFHGLAIAYHGTGNQEDAHKAAERAREHARTAEEIDRAEQLLSFLDASAEAPWAPTAGTRPESARPMTDGGERPEIRRPDPETRPPDEPQPKATREVTGAVAALDCLGRFARLRMIVEGAALNLAIVNPTEVVVTSAANGVAQLNCGPQTGLSATVEYLPVVDEELDTVGAVKRIHFQGP
jgi:tetratricopeptide (TPR) repeat protein